MISSLKNKEKISSQEQELADIINSLSDEKRKEVVDFLIYLTNESKLSASNVNDEKI